MIIVFLIGRNCRKMVDAAKSKQIKNQGHIDSFHRLSRCGTVRIPSDWPNCQQEILFVMRHLREVNLKKGLEL